MSQAVVSTPKRHRLPSRILIAYVLAVVLPLLSFFITTHVPSLKPFPLALQWLSMALVATLGGLGPALTAVFIAVGERFYHLGPGPYPPMVLQGEIIRSTVIFSGALIISITVSRRFQSERELEVALTDLQERGDALVESLSSSKGASWVLDLDQNESGQWQPGSYPVFGRPFAELENLPTLEGFIYPDDRESVAALFRKARSSNEPFISELRAVWPNGDVHWLEMRGTRIPGPGLRWRGVTLDITERKLAEAAVLRSEKLAAMGRLASTVAHEINNPLEAVTNLLFLARGDTAMEATTRSYLSMAERELARLGNITRLTLGFVRANSTASEVEMTEALDDVLSLLQHRFLAGNIAIERNYEPGLRISIPPHELRQIATNLIANAADAVTRDGAKIVVNIKRENGNAALLVEDNGDGIPEANLQRIFDPFFSTKAEIGTGIGLWVTREIVEKNGGHISAESGELPGDMRTRFRVAFPLALS